MPWVFASNSSMAQGILTAAKFTATAPAQPTDHKQRWSTPTVIAGIYRINGMDLPGGRTYHLPGVFQMNFKYLCPIACFIFANVTWGDPAQRPDLNGVWRLEPAQSEIHSHVPSQLTWQIEQSDGAIHLIQRLGDKNDDLRCGTDGKECKVKDEGHPAVISFYYNGPVLVELESQGSNRDTVIKKRFSVSPDGSHLTVDVIHVMPAGKPPEKMVLSKQPATGTN